MSFTKTSLAVLICINFFTGCASPLFLYPDYKENTKEINSVYLFTDTKYTTESLLLGTYYSTNKNDIYAELIKNTSYKMLAKKGYRLNDSMGFAGVGWVNDKPLSDEALDAILKFSFGAGVQSIKCENISIKSAKITSDLRNVFRKLSSQNNKKKAQDKDIYIPDVAKLKEEFNADAYVFVQSYVQSQSMLESFLDSFVRIAFLDDYTPNDTGTGFIKLFVVSAFDGELLWMNTHKVSTAHISRWTVADSVRSIFFSLPKHEKKLIEKT